MSAMQPGEVFLGKYRIEKVLGQGGMGVVVAARHLQLDEPVAIKFLHATFAAQHDQVERFLREGRAAVKIKSEHVARVRDVGTLDNGAPYMIMEHLVGSDLGELLRKEGPLPIGDAVEYVLQACEALAEAHASGIVHRDLKPANLFLTERADGSPCVKVLDFGISKLRDDSMHALTNTNGLMGSPLYMSPEQLSAPKSVDARADVWALGVILFELITGSRPFVADTLPQLVFTVATEPPASLCDTQPDAPRGLEEVIQRCLEKNPRDRIADVAALARALEPFAPPEAVPSIERIVRVLAGTTPGARRQRTARTQPTPSQADASASQGIAPVGDAAVAATVASGAPLASTNEGTVRNSSARAPAVAPKRGNPAALVVAGIAIVVLLIVVAVMRKPNGGAASAPDAPANSTTTAEKPVEKAAVTATAEAPAATTTAPSAPPASATASAPTTAAPTPSATTVAASGATTTFAKGAHASPSAKPSAGKPMCDPPYTIDSEGHKHYKMECL